MPETCDCKHFKDQHDELGCTECECPETYLPSDTEDALMASLDPEWSEANAAALKQINGKQAIPYPPTTGASSQSFQKLFPICKHIPQKVIDGTTWSVWGATKSMCSGTLKKFNIILNLSQYSILPVHKIPVPELQRWETYSSDMREIMLDWPDGDVVALPAEFWIDLRKYLAQSNSNMLIFCLGGHGRTGTAIACLLVASGWTAAQAIHQVRTGYCPEAIENTFQEDYIQEMEDECATILETIKAKKK